MVSESPLDLTHQITTRFMNVEILPMRNVAKVHLTCLGKRLLLERPHRDATTSPLLNDLSDELRASAKVLARTTHHRQYEGETHVHADRLVDLFQSVGARAPPGGNWKGVQPSRIAREHLNQERRQKHSTDVA